MDIVVRAPSSHCRWVGGCGVGVRYHVWMWAHRALGGDKFMSLSMYISINPDESHHAILEKLMSNSDRRVCMCHE